MKKNKILKKTVGLLLGFGLVATVYFACSDESFWKIEPEPAFTISYQTPNQEAGPPPCSISFTNTSNTRGLITTYLWAIDGTQITTEKEALYTFDASGMYSVKLTATNRNASNSIEHTVTIPEMKVSEITITPSGSVSIEVGKTTTLSATVTPGNAANRNIIWSSLHTGIATVNSQTGVVTGVNAGTATIRATAADGSGITADKSITVTPAIVLVTGITITPSGNVSVEAGKTATLSATVSPSNATNKNVTWSSLHTGIATVNSQTGLVTGANAGTATIRATAADGSGKTAEKSITVTKPQSAIEPEMIFVQGGTFQMGCTSEQGSDCNVSETPVHSVTLGSFYIGKHVITRVQWQAITGNNPSWFKGDNLPVEQVSWNDIVGTSGNYTTLNGIRYYENGFIYKLNAATGKKYRLPTEAEWEYAARGGSQSRGYKYSGSNTIGNVAWYKDNSGNTTHAVGTKQANELGIYDMSGNVWEWCQDWYDSSYYSNSPPNNPAGPSSGSSRVIRGGSWYSYGARTCCVSNRNARSPGYSFYDIGFRVALSP